MIGSKSKLMAVAGVALALSALAVEPADARRSGSFGSRGSRTYSAPPPTRTAPTQTAPIQRSMTPQPAPGAQAARPATAAQAPRRGGFLGGLGGGILGGLLMGGLIGAMMGHGFGAGAGGMLALLLQVGILILGVTLLMKLFRRRSQPAAAGMAGWPGGGPVLREVGGFDRQPAAPVFTAPAPASRDIAVTADDKARFERLLDEVQTAFAREDYGTLRELTTPEVMSYLAEELSQNATAGRRNDVSATRLLEADVAEAWHEDGQDYATAALRYESIDIMRDRQTGAVLEGDPERPTETTELWTFVREPGGPWKLSAIQDA
jgi:predicted lipid-binding transport protein (Tim44 family)